MKWAVIVLAMLSGVAAAYTLAYPSYTYRFRITIEVDTASGVKSGSSVIEIKTRQYPRFVTLGANDHETTAKGEAVFVDLGDGKNLVALLALGDHAEDGVVRQFAPRSFFSIRDDARRDVQWAKELSGMRGRRPFAGDRRPTLVTFSEPKDPSTAREVPFDAPPKCFWPKYTIRAVMD